MVKLQIVKARELDMCGSLVLSNLVTFVHESCIQNVFISLIEWMYREPHYNTYTSMIFGISKNYICSYIFIAMVENQDHVW